MVVDGPGNTYAASLRQFLKSRRGVDPVAVDLAALYDHVPQVDPDTKLHLAVARYSRVSGTQLLLYLHRALHRIHHARELCHQIIPCSIHHPAPVALDEVCHDVFACLERSNGPFLVLTHEATVTFHVCTEDCREFTFHFLCGHGVYPPYSVSCLRLPAHPSADGDDHK